jgi:cyclohexanone monooxygenase
VTPDLEQLREKYREERDRRARMRVGGTDHFQFAEGELEQFAEDPYEHEVVERALVDRDVDVLVIGCGIGGIEMAATLRRNGIQDFLMVDGAADFGGTWYWNRYPGIRCDVESYIYLPYLEETGYMPTERYTRGKEIFTYLCKLGRHFGLYERALFQTRITSLTWDAQRSRWHARTNRGDRIDARFVTTQSGIFDRPQLPGIPGITTFKGSIFHSARWNYDYTGANLERLADKDVAVIGTGATGLQIIPELARAARSLTVLQRTPSAVGVRDNAPTDPEWFASLEPGWQRRRIEGFTALANGEEADCGIDDGWVRFFRRMIDAERSLPADRRTPEAVEAAKELADYEHNEEVRARVDAIVTDPDKAAKLKAYYRTLCKRPGFSDDYLPALNRDNVTLLDVSASRTELSPDGVVVDGVETRVDCVILATGFELGTTWSHRAGYEIVGRDGVLVSEKFASGMRTSQGLFSVGFPNLFFTGLTQGGTTTNVPHMLQEQADHVTYLVRRALAEGWATIEATAVAEAAWQLEIERVNESRRAFQLACTPGYFNAEGRVNDRRSSITTGTYRPATEFFRRWREDRANGELTGLVVTRPGEDLDD